MIVVEDVIVLCNCVIDKGLGSQKLTEILAFELRFTTSHTLGSV